MKNNINSEYIYKIWKMNRKELKAESEKQYTLIKVENDLADTKCLLIEVALKTFTNK